MSNQITGTTSSTGVVLHATKEVSLFANRATIFSPLLGVVTIDGATAPARKRKVTMSASSSAPSATSYRDRSTNFRQNKINTLAAELGGLKRGAIDAIWTAVDPSHVTNSAWLGFKTIKTEGYELQVVGNPTANLRLMLTASKNRTIVADKGGDVFAYVVRWCAICRSGKRMPVRQ